MLINSLGICLHVLFNYHSLGASDNIWCWRTLRYQWQEHLKLYFVYRMPFSLKVLLVHMLKWYQ